MLTFKIKYYFENKSDMLLVQDYMNQYNHVFRVAYNKLYNGTQVKQSELSTLNNTELLDSWFVISAIYDAKSLYGSKKDEKVIFGGRNNFIKRCQGKITREEFQQKRLSPLCSVGEKKSGTKSVHGNRKFKLSDDLSFVTFKASNKKIKLNLCKLKPSYKNKLVEIYKHQVLDDIPITYKLDLNYVYIRIPYTLKTMYIQKPCYVQVTMVSNYKYRVSGTLDVEHTLASGEFSELYKEYEKNCCWERYETLGKNMMNPIPFEFYKS